MSLNDGLALIRRHKFEEALPLLASEVRARPEDAYAAYYLAYAFVGAHDPQPALTLLVQLLESHPDFMEARLLLGLARIRTSDFAGAAQAYQAVLNRDPQSAAALLGMGMIHYWRRDTAIAEDCLDRALRIDPAARDAVVFKADLQFNAGDVAAAVTLLRDARRLPTPGLAEVPDDALHDRLQRYEAALQPLRRANGPVPAFPGWVMVACGITLALVVLAGAGLPGALQGVAHYQAGKQRLAALDYSGCASEMEEAIGSVPTSPKVWAYAGLCELLNGDRSAGLSALQTARELEPGVSLDSADDQQTLVNRVRLSTRPTGPR